LHLVDFGATSIAREWNQHLASRSEGTMTASDLKTPEDWDPAIAQYTDDVVKARFNSAVHITPFIPHSYFTPSIRDTHHISFLPHSYFPYRTIVGYQRQLNPQVNALAPQNVLRAKGTLSPSHKQHHKQFERFKGRTNWVHLPSRTHHSWRHSRLKWSSHRGENGDAGDHHRKRDNWSTWRGGDQGDGSIHFFNVVNELQSKQSL
jgi:hypothetical protein